MMNRIRILGLAVALGSLLLLPSVGCLEDDPYYEPQRFTGGAGPNGTAAFVSGEASKTGLKPVKEGGLDAGIGVPDTGGGGGGADAGASEDVEPEVDEPIEI